jgi:hypothetical protein
MPRTHRRSLAIPLQNHRRMSTPMGLPWQPHWPLQTPEQGEAPSPTLRTRLNYASYLIPPMKASFLQEFLLVQMSTFSRHSPRTSPPFNTELMVLWPSDTPNLSAPPDYSPALSPIPSTTWPPSFTLLPPYRHHL